MKTNPGRVSHHDHGPQPLARQGGLDPPDEPRRRLRHVQQQAHVPLQMPTTGIHTDYYMDLKETGGREGLAPGKVVLSSLLTKLAEIGCSVRGGRAHSQAMGREALRRIDTVEVPSYVGSDGFPVIIPLLACQAADSTRLAFSDLATGTNCGGCRAACTWPCSV